MMYLNKVKVQSAEKFVLLTCLRKGGVGNGGYKDIWSIPEVNRYGDGYDLPLIRAMHFNP